MKTIAAILVLSRLSGCAGSPIRYALDPEGETRRETAAHDSRCRSYGAVPGTPAYINCMTQLANTATAARAAQIASAADGIANAAPAYQPPRSIYCTHGHGTLWCN
jgi:hypothetical protein